MHWYLTVLYNYAVFDGRSHREEYWMFVLCNVVIGLVLVLLSAMVGLHLIVGTLYKLAMAFPSIAVTIRRLHDTGKSGWWCLIAFIPIIGAVELLIFMAQDSHPGTNPYGPNPKGLA